jgi:hypothetical protein
MPAPALKVKFYPPKIKRPTWITDIDDLNYIVSVARMVCIQPEKYRIEQLRQAIKNAEEAKAKAKEGAKP